MRFPISRKSLLWILPGLLAAYSVRAQKIEGAYAQMNLNDLARLNGANPSAMALGFDNRYEGIVGSPYLFPQWNTGEVTLFGGKTLPAFPLKYNTHTQQLLWKRPAGDSIVISATPVMQFTLAEPGNDHRRTFRKFPYNGTEAPKPTDDFFEVLQEGKVSLLARREKQLIKANYQGAYSADRRYDELLDRSVYYLRRPSGELVKVKLQKKAVMEVLSDQKTQLESFLKQHRDEIDLSKENGLVQLLAFYNTL